MLLYLFSLKKIMISKDEVYDKITLVSSNETKTLLGDEINEYNAIMYTHGEKNNGPVMLNSILNMYKKLGKIFFKAFTHSSSVSKQ